MTTGLAKIFPQDRLGYALFQQDGVYSDFSYTKFNPEIAAATGDAKAQLLNVKWRQDIGHWLGASSRTRTWATTCPTPATSSIRTA